MARRGLIHIRKTRSTAWAAVGAGLAASALWLTACGGDDEQAGQDGEITAVTVAETQGTPSAFIEFGVQQGFFRQEGLNVKVSPGAGGAANIPKLVSGESQFAGSNVVSVLLGSEQGLPLKMVAPGTTGTDNTERGYSALIVRGDSGIRSPKDLEGKTVAVNTLKNIDDLALKASLDKQGVDVSKLKLIEIPFPDMPGALDAGRVDAIQAIEPFATSALSNNDGRSIQSSFAVVKPFLQVGSYVTTSSYLEKNRDVVEGFAAGVARTARAVREEPKAFRQFLPKAAGLERELASQIVLPAYQEELDRESLELTAQLMSKYGISEEPPNVAELISDTPAAEQ